MSPGYKHVAPLGLKASMHKQPPKSPTPLAPLVRGGNLLGGLLSQIHHKSFDCRASRFTSHILRILAHNGTMDK